MANFYAALLIILGIFIVESATDENLSLQRYQSSEADQLLNNPRKRFQQIMQGSGSSSSSSIELPWPQTAKIEKIDVKTEISKLNTTYVYRSTWPEANVKLGSVTAVSFDKVGNVVIFHRCDRVWGQRSFRTDNVFRQRDLGPIRESTVLGFERKHGQLVYEWGKNLFYMPHGLTIDHNDNVWLTDVALHQVFKFGPRGSNDKPLLTLGTAFTPGSGDTKFCKPTSVAVLKNGDFFVADGYCNARILKYSPNGEKILSWGQNSFAGISYEVAPKNFFAVPHALTLVPEQELVCTADRENGRVQCFYWTNGTFHSQYHSQIIGDRLFSMDYTPARGGQLIIVNGPTAELGKTPYHYNEVRGYVLSLQTKQVVGKFGPNNLQFSNPHDVAVSADGNEVYIAELDPTRIHKFVHKSLVKSMPLSLAKPNTTTGVDTDYETQPESANQTASADDEHTKLNHHHRPGGTAILVASLMLLFTLFTFAMALLLARRRKRGCLPFGEKNQRHAWDFPAKPEGFKLGGLLRDRGKRSGFEKLQQYASDEETETTTTNTHTQFA